NNKEFLNNLPKTKDGLVVFRSTDKNLFLQSSTHKHTSKNNTAFIKSIKFYNGKIYKTTKIKLSDTAQLEVAFNITNIHKEHEKFENTIFILVNIFIMVTALVWFVAIKLYLNSIIEQELKEDELNRRVEEQTYELNKSLDIISNDVIYSKTDLDGVIIEVSKAFCEISQFTEDELIGKTHAIMKHQDTLPELHDLMWHTIEDNQIWYGKTKNRKKDNTSYTFMMTISPQYDYHNNKIGYMAIRHDITAELELARLNENLEQKVKDEVAKNIEKELMLFEQSKMANMGAMIGNIAHQWRQPLSIINTCSTGIQVKQSFNALTNKDIEKFTSTIEQNVNYLSQTIDTFRNFLKEKKELKEVVLQDRIDLALDIAGVSLKDNGITLKNNIEYNNPIKLTLVVGELAEVIINILNNARDILLEKNIEDSWVKLDLETKENTAVISIEDNAGGIPEDILPNIFDE
ncbi:MAG: PAS domain-containing sensor histidine kinase, partial [Campylobacterota bacterium]|nr:PAS domain-containing sensor histidine kinase [Campylobacterota bacterium]